MAITWGTKRLIITAIPVILVVLGLLGCSQTPKTPAELKKSAIECMRNQDFECAEDDWQAYVRLRPNDGEALASLGIVQNQRGEDAQAVVQFQKAIALGEGTYDLFYYYADSLANLGKTDQAIDWYYKTLDVVPSLVDARGNLAKLLVQKKRYFEALALLASLDDHLIAIGQQPYFTGQRIAIESDMQQADPKQFEEKSQIRLSKTYGNFYAPVILGQSRVTAFMVDTGATLTAVSDQFLQKSKAKFEVLRSSVEATTADGRRILARLINIDLVHLGAFDLKDVSALECSG
ncbi:MAG: retroviral-like aspartic protease family protein, partial [Gammaproteobacteria bacterium]